MTDNGADLDVMHARQARRGRHAFIILVSSLALVLVAFAAVYVFHFEGFAGLRGNQEAAPQVARAVTAEPAPVKQKADEPRPDSGG